MNLKLKEIKEELDRYGLESAIDKAFKYFIDNQINKIELKELLDEIEYKVPEDLFLRRNDEIKIYRKHTQRIIEFNNGTNEYSYEIYNKVYFDELAYCARRNKATTKTLIEYSNKLNSFPIHIRTMQEVRIKNIDYALTHDKWLKIIEDKNYKTLYDFIMGVMKMPPTSEKEELIGQIKEYLKKVSTFNLDLDLPFNKFAFDIELLLSCLNPKVANTIKVKFLVYTKDMLNDSDYNKDIQNPRTLINKFRDQFLQGTLTRTIDYYTKNQDILDSFNDNGYRAIYYAIIAED